MENKYEQYLENNAFKNVVYVRKENNELFFMALDEDDDMIKTISFEIISEKKVIVSIRHSYNSPFMTFETLTSN